MRFSSLAIYSITAVLVSAQTASTGDAATDAALQAFAELPDCVLSCIMEAIPKTECALTDTACLCTDQAYAASTQQCLLASCSIKDSLRAQTWQYKTCPVQEHDAGKTTIRVGISLLILTTLVIAGRFLARWQIQTAGVGLDDWSILLSFIIFIPATALVIHMAQNGMGSDIWTVSFAEIYQMLKIFYIVQYFYQVVVSLTKVSIVLLYMRIFPKEVFPKFHIICWAVIGGLIAYAFAFCVVFIAECQPISFFWTQWDREHTGQCVDIQLSAYINGGFNILFDLIVFFLPIPRLLKLQVSDKMKKIGILFTFLIGLFVTCCSIVRLQYLAAVGRYTNVTYHYNYVAFWTGLEAYLGIICACMPAILGPITKFFRNTIGSKISSYAKSTGFSKGSSGFSKGSSSTRSRITQDKTVTRLPSESNDRGDEMELAKHPQTGGVAEKGSFKSFYDVSGEQTSRDSREDLELTYHRTRRDERRQYDL